MSSVRWRETLVALRLYPSNTYEVGPRGSRSSRLITCFIVYPSHLFASHHVLLSLPQQCLPAATFTVSWMVQVDAATARHMLAASSAAPQPISARATAPGPPPGPRWR